MCPHTAVTANYPGVRLFSICICQEMGEIKGHMYTLNYRTALAVSIVLFNFGTMAVLGETAEEVGQKKEIKPRLKF